MAIPSNLNDPTILAPGATATIDGASVPVWRNRKLTPGEAPTAGTLQGSFVSPVTPLDGMGVEDLQRRIDESPLVRQALAEGSDIREAMQIAGIPTEAPHDYRLNEQTGQYERLGFMERNPWVTGALIAGGVAGGGLAAGALSGSGAGTGAGASAGTGAGVGTGATVAGVAPGTIAATTPTIPAALSAGAGGGMAGGSSILGSLLSNPETYSTLAGQLGRLGEGQGAERGNQNAAAADANRLLANLFATEQGASSHAADATERGVLDRAGFEESQKQSRARLGLEAPNVRTRQSILGSLLQELQPVTFGDTGRVKVPEIRGGLTPAALNAAARQTGGILQKQAIDALLSGSDVPEMTAIPEMTDFQAARLPKPELNTYREPGTGESILSGIGAAGNITQGILEQLRRQSENPNQTGARG